MRHDVIPPLSDCVQLSVDQYRAKLYDIIRAEKAGRRLKQESNEKLAERRASSHELREKTSIGERNHGDHLRGDVVRKVISEVSRRAITMVEVEVTPVRGCPRRGSAGPSRSRSNR